MFNKNDFLNYVKNKFPGCCDKSWNGDILENIIDYGLQHHNYSKNQLVYFLYYLIPEIDFEEIRRFYSF